MAFGGKPHTEFKDITIHTAKCDICNKHNKHVIKQCDTCGMNFCTPCLSHRGGDGTHYMNDGDTGYAGAVASKAKKEKFLKPKGEKVEKSESPTNSPPRMSRKKVTRRRRVVIEESEEEEMDDGRSYKDACSKEASPEEINERRVSERHREKLPELRIEDVSSPRAEGPPNCTNSTGSQLPGVDETAESYPHNLNLDTSNLDNDTLDGADTLLSFAAGPGSRRTSDTEYQMNLRGGAGNGSFSSGVSQLTAASDDATKQHVPQLSPLSPIFVHPEDNNIHSYTALTPLEPTWLNTPAATVNLLSGLFPYEYNHFNFDDPLWSSTTAAPMHFPNNQGSNGDIFNEPSSAGSSNEDLWNELFGDANGSSGTKATTVDGDGNGAAGKGEEEGEVKEGGAAAADK